MIPERRRGQTESLSEWHRRLGHPSVQVLRKMLQKQGMQVIPSSQLVCDVCLRTKLTQKVYDKMRDEAIRPGEIISADLIGPIQPMSVPNNFRFVLTVIHHYTRFARKKKGYS